MDKTALTLADFMLARLAEDDLFWETVGDWGQAHPERVLRYRADCAAKRRVVEMRLDAAAAMGVTARDVATRTMVSDRDYGWGVKGRFDALETALRVLSVPYVCHPDYREEWKV